MNDQEMQQALRTALQPLEPILLVIKNESANHAGYYEGKASHMNILLVSNAFLRKNRVTQHQMVYRQIQHLLLVNGGALHAAALHTYTPEQWAKTKHTPVSPACAGQRNESV